jgi:hypothetical protein
MHRQEEEKHVYLWLSQQSKREVVASLAGWIMN